MTRLYLSSLLLVFALSGQSVEFNPDSMGGWEKGLIENLFEEADHGSAEAQFQLGVAYYEGESIEQDYYRCEWWTRRAAMAGHPYAQGFLGAMYADGIGVPQDDAGAYVWFAVAAAHGNDYAVDNLERLARRLSPLAFLVVQTRIQHLNAKIQEGLRTGKPHGNSGPSRPPVRPPSRAVQSNDRNLT